VILFPLTVTENHFIDREFMSSNIDPFFKKYEFGTVFCFVQKLIDDVSADK
jgi:hypothetical protein